MRFLRRSKSDEPNYDSYQQKLRAIGRQLDQNNLRFRLLVELPDGFLLKAEGVAHRQQGESVLPWASETFWLKDPDIHAMVDDAFSIRDENRTS